MNHPWLPLAATMLALAGSALADERPVLPVFASVDELNTRCEVGLAIAQRKIDAFANAPRNAQSAATALRRWDEIFTQVEDLLGGLDIAAFVAPDGKIRDAADACNVRIASLFNGLYQNRGAYEQIRLVKAPAAADAEMLKVLNEGFEDAGVTLPEDGRKRAREILDRLDLLAIEFHKNTREVRSTIDFAPADLAGLPAGYLERHKPGTDGRVALTMDYTDYFPFMENAVSEEARKRYFVAFNNVGGERNLAILAEANGLRKELAGLFGKPSYAEFALQRRMAGTPKAVWTFLDQVRVKVDEVQRSDLAVLRQAKSAMLGTPLAETRIERWDVPFYTERVRRERYAIDQETLRRYFPSEASVAWMFDLAKRLYGVRFVAANVPVWHPDVRYYDVLDARGRRIAGAYLDLYPRPGKYNHAAVWPVRHGSTLAGRTPIGVLVANLDRNGLNHRELETLLHEFGHLLHGNLSRTRYASLSGTNTRRDFVEAPSQMFEEWARREKPLALMRDHCKECPVADAALLTRLNRARLFGAGIRYARQHMLATFDMQLAGPTPGDPQTTWKALEDASPVGHVPGTRFPAQFGHLVGGYAAGYYGYMWSEVIALDMASRWEGNLLDRKVSRRYLDRVLSRGGETPPQRLVRDFLGREPSPEPFFAEITGRRS